MKPGSHPRDPRGLGGTEDRPGIGRRAFLARAAGTGLTAAGLGSLLAGCGRGYAAAPRHTQLPTPGRPVRWPIYHANQPIADGQAPEVNATLRVYTWPDHVSQRCLKDFARTYRCQVQRTTFSTIIEAIRTVIHGSDRFDVFLGVPTDVIGLLVGRSAIQPLNHSYLPNIGEAWPVFTDPYYDSHWLYTVPYTVYTTGLAWRKDLVDADPYAMINGWQFPWVAGGKGRTAILDDYRESIGLALLKNGERDINTTDPLLIDNARQALLDLGSLVGLRINNATSRQIAAGRTWVHHAWSGQAVAAARHLPPGVPADVIGYWFPPDGTGPVANDTGTVLRGAQNPVLAHLFLNFMLSRTNVMHNIAATGYTQPITYATPSRLVQQGILPASLTSAAVLSTYLDHGLKKLELQESGDRLWRQAWHAVSHES